MKNDSYLFVLNNIYFAYPRSENILENINLKVRQHDIIIVKGESGTGKSSFLKLFNRFSDVIEGTLMFRGRNLSEYNVDEIRGSIMYLPQLPHVIEGTIEENLIFPFQFQTHSNKYFDRKRAQELFDYFHLNLSIDNDALTLSVGQKQRMALIRTILLEPEVLLLDEPGSALDEVNQGILENQIALLTESAGITVIMATHSHLCFKNRYHRGFIIQEKNLIEDTCN